MEPTDSNTPTTPIYQPNPQSFGPREPHIPISESEMQQEPPQKSSKNMLLTLASILILAGIVGITIFLYIQNRSHNFSKINTPYSNDKNSENVDFSSLPIEKVTKKQIVGSGKPLDAPCTEAKIYYSMDEALKDPQNVCILALNNANLSSLPKDISKLSNLRYLFLNNNNLTQFPQQLLTMNTLWGVNLSGNPISQIPASIKDMQELSILVIKNSQLSAATKAQLSTKPVHKNFQIFY